MRPMRVLSLFDGISCGMLAFDRAGIRVHEYAAFEIDKYAKAISRFNYPEIRQYGNVLTADFSMFAGFDIVIGGSPCTFWSCAKGNGREVDRSGTGWMLFSRFADAVRTVRPKYFLYENVASMPAMIKAYISEELGIEPIMINSALVSAQTRKRLYWTNISDVSPPADKGISLQDVLTSGLAYQGKSHCVTATYQGAAFRNSLERRQRSMIAERVIHAAQSAGGGIYEVCGKSVTLTADGGKTRLHKIDLPDGEYIFRKLTPVEAERCQTLPDGYTAFGADENGNTVKISNTRRYKCIGNGWTVDVVAHIFSHITE